MLYPVFTQISEFIIFQFGAILNQIHSEKLQLLL
jgi:hypothetical protein